jgi:hypothetical protein
VKLIRCHYSKWEHFRCFHYDPNIFNRAARCYLVEVNGKRVGFVASLPMPSGTLKNAWRAHKTVVLLAADHPWQKELWAKVADAQAEMHLREGHQFFSTAPIEYAQYRENPASGWIPTSKNERRKRTRGEGSHEYKGVK